MASTYVVRFNLMPAEEAGIVTGHSSVTLQEISDQGLIVTNRTFAVSSDSGNLFTWVAPYVPINDGYFGLEHPELVALANSSDAIHAYVSVDQSTFLNIIGFVTSPPTGGAAAQQKAWSEPGFPSYEVNYSLSGVGGYSCISFANTVYS